jgi:hypothetical protein
MQLMGMDIANEECSHVVFLWEEYGELGCIIHWRVVNYPAAAK